MVRVRRAFLLLVMALLMTPPAPGRVNLGYNCDHIATIKAEGSKMTKAKSQAKGAKAETRKESSFSKVDRGICPHDVKSLGDDIAGRGEGVTRKCAACEHLWYLNRKIKTCKCLTCSATKRTQPG